MTNVVELDKFRPHVSGQAKCAGCNHEWVAVAPTGTVQLECPNCERLTGRFYCGAMPETFFECNCGSSCFVLSPHAAICYSCGEIVGYEDL